MSIEEEENRPRQEQGRNRSGYLDSAMARMAGIQEFTRSNNRVSEQICEFATRRKKIGPNDS